MGDLNFRIDGISNEEVRKRIKENDLAYLSKYDQVLTYLLQIKLIQAYIFISAWVPPYSDLLLVISDRVLAYFLQVQYLVTSDQVLAYFLKIRYLFIWYFFVFSAESSNEGGTDLHRFPRGTFELCSNLQV